VISDRYWTPYFLSFSLSSSLLSASDIMGSKIATGEMKRQKIVETDVGVGVEAFLQAEMGAAINVTVSGIGQPSILQTLNQ
jgi:hypothetical protein